MKAPIADSRAPSRRDAHSEHAGCLVQIYPLELNSGFIPISANPFTIGRDPDCDLQVRDDSVSRQHGLIEYRDSAYWVTDLDSTNGVYVNDKPVRFQNISAGDRLRLGNHIFKFLDEVEAQYHETVYHMMTRDGLTSAYNKRYFVEVLNRNVKRCHRRLRPMSLILMDIDHFQQINDTFGRLAGDEILRELSARIMTLTREDEVFARFGGEEFALLIFDGNKQEAAQMAERLRALIKSNPFRTSAGAIPVTLSVGVAEYDLASLPADLITFAEQKLYQAKASGRDHVCV